MSGDCRTSRGPRSPEYRPCQIHRRFQTRRWMGGVFRKAACGPLCLCRVDAPMSFAGGVLWGVGRAHVAPGGVRCGPAGAASGAQARRQTWKTGPGAARKTTRLEFIRARMNPRLEQVLRARDVRAARYAPRRSRSRAAAPGPAFQAPPLHAGPHRTPPGATLTPAHLTARTTTASGIPRRRHCAASGQQLRPAKSRAGGLGRA
jgi:hypothetical protein